MYHGVTQDTPSDSPDAPEPSDAKGDEREPKKERVLHTRIPAVLESELKTLAKSLRVPLSNLVRTILEDAVTIAERASGQLEDRLEGAAERVHSERQKMKKRLERVDPLADVIAYQTVTVARATPCVKCEAMLPGGTRASLAIDAAGGPQRLVCDACLPANNSEGEP